MLKVVKVTIIATRIAGNDGVSLEAEHWRRILTSMGHKVTLIAGQLDKAGILLPSLHFQHALTAKLYNEVVYGKNNYDKVEAKIFAQAGVIEGELRDVFRLNPPDLLIVPNVLSLPMHFPLAVALARIIEEKELPTIARHHDFWWERERFNNSTLFHFYERFFPPLLPSIKHVVINSDSQKEFLRRTGIKPTIIADTSNFVNVKHKKDAFSKHFRSDFGIAEDDVVFLQATRIVPRKRIELAIDLVDKLNNPKAVLVIAGVSGDEGSEYERFLQALAAKRGARVKFIGKYINSHRKIYDQRTLFQKRKKRRIYTLWDCYVNADFITYPTELEGFGNQFLEAVLYKKPVIVTPYPVYKTDIDSLGFESIIMPDKVTPSVIKQITNLQNNPAKVKQMTQNNFDLGEKYFSYQAVERKLHVLFKKMELEK